MASPLDPMRHLMDSGAINPAQQTGAAQPASRQTEGTGKTDDGKTFSDVLQDFVKQVDDSQKDFDKAIEAVERGETDNLHQVMIAQGQAQLSLKLAAEVRDKLVEAYREVMRTQF